MKVRQSPSADAQNPLGPNGRVRNNNDISQDFPSFDLGYVDYGTAGSGRGLSKPPIGAGAANFVRASFVSPGAGPRRSLRDSQRRHSSRRRRPANVGSKNAAAGGGNKRRRCLPDVLGNLKDALLSCVAGGRTFEPASPRPVSSPVSPSKPFSPRVGVYQLSQAHLASSAGRENGGGESGDELESGAGQLPANRTVNYGAFDHSSSPLGDAVASGGGGPAAAVDFDATMSSTHSASQPTAEDESPRSPRPASLTAKSAAAAAASSTASTRSPSFKKPHPPSKKGSLLNNPCIDGGGGGKSGGGRDSVSSQGSESFQISTVDRKRALAKSLWTKADRDSLRDNNYRDRNNVVGDDDVKTHAENGRLRPRGDARAGDDAFGENASNRPRSLASSSRRHSEMDADAVLLNSFRSSTRSKKSLKAVDRRRDVGGSGGVSGVSGDGVDGAPASPEQSLLSHHPSLNSTSILLPPTPFLNDSSFRGSSHRSSRLNDHDDDPSSLRSPTRSAQPPPKPSRSTLSPRGDENDAFERNAPSSSSARRRGGGEGRGPPKSSPSGRPTPGPQSSGFFSSTKPNGGLSNHSGLSSTRPSHNNSISNHGVRENTHHAVRGDCSKNNNNNNNVSILKSRLHSSSEASPPHHARESFRVRFQRSASTDRPRAVRQRGGEDPASRRRSRSADDYVLDGTPLANGLGRSNSRVRVLDLSNPEIVSYEMEEADFVAEFKKDFLDQSVRSQEELQRLRQVQQRRVQHRVQHPQRRVQQQQQQQLQVHQRQAPPRQPQIQLLREDDRYEPRRSDDSVDADMTVKEFLTRNGDESEADRKLLDGFFNYTSLHRDSTSGDDDDYGDDSAANDSISEDSLEAPRTPAKETSFFDNVDEIAPGGGGDVGGRATFSSREKNVDFGLKIPSYGNNLFLEGISGSKSTRDPGLVDGVPSNAYVCASDANHVTDATTTGDDDPGINHHNDNNNDDTSDYSQDSSEQDSEYTRQLRDLQARMKNALIHNNNKIGSDGRPGENSSFDSAFDSLERPAKALQRHHVPQSSSLSSTSSSAAPPPHFAHPLASSLRHPPPHRRSLSSPSSSSTGFGFEATLLPQDLNGNLSTVEELSRASSVVSRSAGVGGGGGGGDASAPEAPSLPTRSLSSKQTDSTFDRQNIFSVTSADSQYEFDSDRLFDAAGKSTHSEGGTWRKSFTSSGGEDVVSPKELPSSTSAFGSPHKRHLPSTTTEAAVKRDSFGNVAPGRVANLRAGFEGGRR